MPVLARLPLLALLIVPAIAAAEPRPSIAMHGEPALPADFSALPYVNPDAPKGGTLVWGVEGSFDSVNPFIIKGATAAGVNTLVFETLMRRSADEPFSFYPLVAETIDVPDDRSFAEFRIDPRARFSDGTPITADDVAFTWRLLKDHGRPNVRQAYSKVANVEVKDERTIRFDLGGAGDRELPLILAAMVVLPRHATDPERFEESTLKPMVGSGPYVFGGIAPGRSLTLKRDPNWWGRDLPSNRGLYNFDDIRYDYFRDGNSMFEGFTAGQYNYRPETDAARWANRYDFPAVKDGRVIKDTIENGIPKGMNALVFNTRRPIFHDPAVREAISLLFDFEWANRNLYFDLYRRTCSFFEGSELSACGQPASEAERRLLAAFPDAVRPDVMDGSWRPVVTDGSGRDRTVARRATALLKGAGWRVEDGVMTNPEGLKLRFEILVASRDQERLALNFSANLKRIGIEAVVRLADDVGYRKRQQTFDFDMIQFRWPASLSPGNEQNFRWSSGSADAEGSFNYAGVKNPAADAMIKAMLAARTREDFVAATRALDRVLMSGIYVVPLFNTPVDWLARWKTLERPAKPALTGAPVETFWSTTR